MSIIEKLDKSRFKKARKAFEEKDVQQHILSHSHENIAVEPWHKTSQGRYIAPAVYGASDGRVTTFAVVAGAQGAGLSPLVVLVLGFANLFADGFSMAVGDYISDKSEREYIKTEKAREEWEVKVNPEGERDELREIYRRKGVKEEELESFLDTITSNHDLWIDTMMHEELGLMEDNEGSPLKSAMVTFFSFVIAGFMPLMAFVFSSFISVFADNMFLSASIITALTLFTVGALRYFVTGKKWIVSGLEMMVTGGLSAAVAYLVGFIFKAVFNVQV